MKFKSGNGGGSNPNLVFLKSGESVTGVLRGNPHEYEKAFKPEDKPKFRFQLNIVVKENGALTAKIVEGGWKLYSQLKQLSEAGWDLEKSYVQIARQGSGLNDTVYSATVLPTPVPAATFKQVEAVKLHVLGDGAGPVAQVAEPGADEDGEAPF